MIAALQNPLILRKTISVVIANKARSRMAKVQYSVGSGNATFTLRQAKYVSPATTQATTNAPARSRMTLLPCLTPSRSARDSYSVTGMGCACGSSWMVAGAGADANAVAPVITAIGRGICTGAAPTGGGVTGAGVGRSGALDLLRKP